MRSRIEDFLSRELEDAQSFRCVLQKLWPSPYERSAGVHPYNPEAYHSCNASWIHTLRIDDIEHLPSKLKFFEILGPSVELPSVSKVITDNDGPRISKNLSVLGRYSITSIRRL